ncbi:glycosyl hydrolase [Microdochium nivale]|nr:glycosyl hydrolase [Microdochium nivale]
MFTKHSLIALALAVASISEAAAANIHRHHDARQIKYAVTETLIETAYATVTVTAGQEPAPIATPPVVEQPAVEEPAAPAPAPSPVVPPVQEGVVQPIVQPIAPPTTLVTQAPSTTPVVELPEPTVVVPSQFIPILLPSSTAPAPAPTSPTAPAIGSKRGAAYNDVGLVNALVGMSNKISWSYNWGASTSGLKQGVEFVPMLWGPQHTDGWTKHAETGIANGATALLSCNEPDIASQANISPAAAAQFHIANMNPFAGKARIGSPAISSSQNKNQGIDYLGQFFAACAGQCVVDFCAVHWYGPGGNAGADLFLKHVKDAHVGCQNKPLWITEFGVDGAGTDEFMRKVMPALESDEFSYVERYAPFFVATGYIMQSSTALSSWGSIFAGLS